MNRFSEGEYRTQAEFRCSLRRFLRFAEERAMARGITAQQYLLLLVIRGHSAYPEVSVSDVADCLQIRHHSASLLIDRAVRRNLVTRRENPHDRRRMMLALTDAGQSMLDDVMGANRDQLAQVAQSSLDGLLHEITRVAAG